MKKILLLLFLISFCFAESPRYIYPYDNIHRYRTPTVTFENLDTLATVYGWGDHSKRGYLTDANVSGDINDTYIGVLESFIDLSTSTGLVYDTTGTISYKTLGIANTNILAVDDASAADNMYAKFTANGLEGRTYANVLADLSGQAGAAFGWNSQSVNGINELTATKVITATIDGPVGTDIQLNPKGTPATVNIAGGFNATLTSVVGNLYLASGNIADSGGTISFNYPAGANNSLSNILNLTATGKGTFGTIGGGDALQAAALTINSAALYTTIVEDNDDLRFDGANLSGIGTIASGDITVDSDLVFSAGSIKSSSSAISFDNENLSTTGTGTFGNNANAKQLIVKANASQTVANPLVDLQDSAGNSLLPITSNHNTNIFMGYQAGEDTAPDGANDGQRNVFIGYQAGAQNTTGYGNFALGKGALGQVTTGIRNMAIGADAMLFGNPTYSVAIGYGALRLGPNQCVAIGKESAKNTTGTVNVVIGDQAGEGVSGQSTYNASVFIGTSAGFAKTSGNNCTFIGYQAGTAVTTGANNLLIGYKSGDNLTTGSNNIIIGHDINASAVGVSNELNIGSIIYSPDMTSTVHFGDGITNTNYTAISATGILDSTLGTATLGAGVTTFAITSNVMTITGDVGGNTVATITGASRGTILTLIFVDGLVTITDTDAHTANTVDLSAAFTSADDTTLQLVYNGTSWYEISRSVN